jgi:hypothetical protein
MGKLTESDYAATVVGYFESQGYEVFKEVGYGGGSNRADIYCKRGDDTVAVEVKLRLNLTVIDQAFYWRNRSNFSYVAVPYAEYRNLPIAQAICESFGIGLILIGYGGCKILVDATRNSEPKSTPCLYEEQKSSVAGNADGDFVTPFKITATRLVGYVQERGPVQISEAVKSIEHHYSNDKSAVSGLRKMIDWGVISQLVCYKEKNKLFLKISGDSFFCSEFEWNEGRPKCDAQCSDCKTTKM